MPDLSDEELRKDIYAWYGAAAYHIQCFEQELIIALIMLWRIEHPNATEEAMDKRDTELSTKTLGQLIRYITKAGIVDAGVADQLEQWNKQRIYVVHHYFSQNSEKLMGKRGWEEMVAELKELSAEFQIADEVATKMSQRLRKFAGMSEDLLNELVEADSARVRALYAVS